MWPDLNRVDYAIGAMQERVYHGRKFDTVYYVEAGDCAGVIDAHWHGASLITVLDNGNDQNGGHVEQASH